MSAKSMPAGKSDIRAQNVSDLPAIEDLMAEAFLALGGITVRSAVCASVRL